jgi:putative ATPase
MAAQRLYTPSPRGFEARIADRLAEWARRREELRRAAARDQ